MFGKSKKSKVTLIGFLDQADDAYMLAFESKNIKPFVPYADSTVCTAVLQEILSKKDQCFGASKLRKRSWEVVLDDGRIVKAMKHITHEPIKCGRGLSIPLGDPVSQAWDISVNDVPQFQVIKIRRVQDES